MLTCCLTQGVTKTSTAEAHSVRPGITFICLFAVISRASLRAPPEINSEGSRMAFLTLLLLLELLQKHCC